MAGSNEHLKEIRRANKALVARCITDHGPISRPRIVELAGLTMPCVCGLVEELLRDGAVREVGVVTGYRGRPSALLEALPPMGCVAGVVIQDQWTLVAIVDKSGDIVAKDIVYRKTNADSPVVVSAELADTIKRLSRGCEPLLGVGVTVSGFADPSSGVIDSIGNRPGWENLDVADILSGHCDVPVFLDNDIRAAALAAYDEYFSNNRDGSLCFLACEGIGTAMIVSHGIAMGPGDITTSLQRVTMENLGPSHKGPIRASSISQAADISAIINLWPEIADEAKCMPIGDRRDYVSRAVEMALAGECNAVAAIRTMASYLAKAIVNSASMFDLHCAVICGTIPDLMPKYLLDAVRGEVRAALPATHIDLDIRLNGGMDELLMRSAARLCNARGRS